MNSAEARKGLRAASGKISNPRPRDIDTPELFNAHIDRSVKALKALKIKSVKVTVEVETEESAPDDTEEKRQQTEGANRMHEGGSDRSE